MISEKLILEIFERVKDRITLRELRELSTDEIVELVRLYTSEEFSAYMVPVIEEQILLSGQYGMIIELLPRGAISSPYLFSIATQMTADYIASYTARDVKEISDKTAEAMRQKIERHERESINPRQTARDIKRDMGLTATQEAAVANYERLLRSGSKSSLTRALRDKRYDKMLRDGRTLSEEQINRAVDRYRQKYLKYRAEVIARTEQGRAVAVGQRQSMLQAKLQGKLSDRLRRFWVYTHDSRTRHFHATVPMLNPLGVAIDESYLTKPPGRVEFLEMPKDPEGSAENVIQCRCRERYKMI